MFLKVGNTYTVKPMPDLNDTLIEEIREWQKHPVTKRFKNVLQAKLIEAQQGYAAANSIDQFRYQQGIEIGYFYAMDALDNLQNSPAIDMISVPVFTEKPEKKNGK